MRQPLLRLVWIFLLAALLYWALKNAPLTEIWSTLQQLRFWQIASLIGINAVIYALITLRWWIVTRAEAKQVPYFPLLAVRIAVFGVSYFTLGPQVGGEPLQVIALRHRHGLTYTRAASTVLVDKLLEFLANFVLLAFGLGAVARAGILSSDSELLSLSLIGIVVMVMWPPVHIILLRHRRHPIASILRKFPKNKFTRFVIAMERLAGAFCRRHFNALVGATFISLVAAAFMLGEYFLIVSFLQIELSAPQTVAAWTAGWLAFLVPWPGGLGALEASQVFALSAFGVSAASAIGVTLVIRARDLFIGGLGLLFASRGVAR